MSVRAIKAMKAKTTAQTITIYAMKSEFYVETNYPITEDAEDSFGGRKEKNTAKKKNTKHDYDE